MGQTKRYELDVRNLEYLAPPIVPDWFEHELTQLLPLNPFGEPQLIVVWGMDARCFRNDNPAATKYVAAHEKIVTRKFRRLDGIEGVYEYFDTREEARKALNIRLLDTIEFKNTREVRVWGPPRWIIEQWFSPEKIDKPQVWNRNRYAEVEDRQGKTIRFDALGPYPSRGQYRESLVVQDAEGGFRDLDRGVMTELRRRVKEREIYSWNDHTNAQEIRDQLAADAAAVAREEKQIEDDFIDDLGPSKYRIIEGNAFSGYRAPPTLKPSRKETSA
jgi:hypothetical protein